MEMRGKRGEETREDTEASEASALFGTLLSNDAFVSTYNTERPRPFKDSHTQYGDLFVSRGRTETRVLKAAVDL